MSELYGDRYASDSGGPDRLIPERLRRIAGAAVFVGVIGAMGLWAYDLGTRDAADVPVIRAMEGPARIQPEDPGGLTAAHQGLEVNSVLAGQPAPRIVDTTPIPPPPVLLAEEDGPQGELVLAPQTSLLEPADLPMPPGDETLALVQPDPSLTAPLAGPSLEDAIAAALRDEAAASSPPAAATGTGPLRRPANLARSAAARQPAPPPIAREVASVGAGARLVQLGAYDSEDLTRKAWAQLVASHGDLLGDRSLYVERTTANARVFYRLRVAGFDTSAETGALCEALRARSVDCIPVTLQ